MGSRLNIRASRVTGRGDDVLEGVGPLPTLPPLPLLLLLLLLLLMRRGWRHLPSSPFRHNTVTCLLWSTASTSRCCISQHGFMTHTQQTLTNGDSWCKLICAVLYLIHIFTLQPLNALFSGHSLSPFKRFHCQKAMHGDKPTRGYRK